jgi:hypothetical protein
MFHAKNNFVIPTDHLLQLPVIHPLSLRFSPVSAPIIPFSGQGEEDNADKGLRKRKVLFFHKRLNIPECSPALASFCLASLA